MNSYVLITGGSEGIGLELAKLFAKDKHNLILVARNEEKLIEAKEVLSKYKVEVLTLSLDISNMDKCDELITYIESEKLNIDILINNAGIGSFGDFSTIEWEKEEQLIDINIKALTKLTKYFLKIFIKEDKGGILNVASTAAFSVGPRMAAYYATKAYVLNLTEAIAEEVSESNVNISCLCPGPVKTSFQGNAGIKKSEATKKYLMEPMEVAKYAYRDFKKGKIIIIPGLKNKLLVNINKLTPRWISRKIILKTNKK